MDSGGLLTDLHYFGIPMAAFEFPLGVSVPLNTVHATAALCILHPSVSNLSLRRIGDAEFELRLSDRVPVTPQALQDLVATLVLMGEAVLPITVRQVLITQAQDRVETEVHRTTVQAGTITKHETHESSVRKTAPSTTCVELTIEVDLG